LRRPPAPPGCRPAYVSASVAAIRQQYVERAPDYSRQRVDRAPQPWNPGRPTDIPGSRPSDRIGINRHAFGLRCCGESALGGQASTLLATPPVLDRLDVVTANQSS